MPTANSNVHSCQSTRFCTHSGGRMHHTPHTCNSPASSSRSSASMSNGSHTHPPLIPASCSPVQNDALKKTSGRIRLNDGGYGISRTKSASDLVVAALVSSAHPARYRYRHVTPLTTISQRFQRDTLPPPPDQPRIQRLRTHIAVTPRPPSDPSPRTRRCPGRS